MKKTLLVRRIDQKLYINQNLARYLRKLSILTLIGRIKTYQLKRKYNRSATF